MYVFLIRWVVVLIVFVLTCVFIAKAVCDRHPQPALQPALHLPAPTIGDTITLSVEKGKIVATTNGPGGVRLSILPDGTCIASAE